VTAPQKKTLRNASALRRLVLAAIVGLLLVLAQTTFGTSSASAEAHQVASTSAAPIMTTGPVGQSSCVSPKGKPSFNGTCISRPGEAESPPRHVTTVCPAIANKSSSNGTCSTTAGAQPGSRPGATTPKGESVCPSAAGKVSSIGSCSAGRSVVPRAAADAQSAETPDDDPDLSFVSFTADTTNLDLMHSATLTAVISSNVAVTPYYLYIYDETTMGWTARCGGGTECSVSVSLNAAGTETYNAFVGDWLGSPINVQSEADSPVDVQWNVGVVSLTATNTTPLQLTTTTLTATAAVDVGPTNYYIYIYDVDSMGRIATCGGGTTCSVDLTLTDNDSHHYKAFVGIWDNTLGPTQVQADSGSSSLAVTAQQQPMVLTASSTSPAVNDTITLTATGLISVGPTNYYILIFDVENGVLLASCGGGIGCSTTVTDSSSETRVFRAAVGIWAGGPLPTQIQAQSPLEYVDWSEDGGAEGAIPNPYADPVSGSGLSLPCGENVEPTNLQYVEAVFKNDCDTGIIEWIITLTPAMQATVDGQLAEYGLAWERNGTMMPQNAPHLEDADYYFHGTLNPVAVGDTIFFMDELTYEDFNADTVTVEVYGSLAPTS